MLISSSRIDSDLVSVFVLMTMSTDDDRIDHHLQRLRELRELYDGTAKGTPQQWVMPAPEVAGEFVQALDLAIAFLAHRTGH